VNEIKRGFRPEIFRLEGYARTFKWKYLYVSGLIFYKTNLVPFRLTLKQVPTDSITNRQIVSPAARQLMQRKFRELKKATAMILGTVATKRQRHVCQRVLGTTSKSCHLSAIRHIHGVIRVNEMRVQWSDHWRYSVDTLL
jgi:hypothetical protein